MQVVFCLLGVSTFRKEGIDAADSPSIGLNLIHQITNIMDLKAVVTDQACNLIDAKLNRRRMRIVWWTAGNSVATPIHSIDDLVRLVCIEIVMKECPHGFVWPKGTNNCVAKKVPISFRRCVLSRIGAAPNAGTFEGAGSAGR